MSFSVGLILKDAGSVALTRDWKINDWPSLFQPFLFPDSVDALRMMKLECDIIFCSITRN